MRLFSFAFIILFSFNSIACDHQTLPSGSDKEVTEAASFDKDAMVHDILSLINEHRRSIGKSPLQLINQASAEATKHSTDMAFGRTPFGHDGFDDRWDDLTKKMGKLAAMAENVAYGHIDAKQVVDLWINSAGHRKNLEGNFNFTGIGLAQSQDGTIYFTQIFLRK